MAATHYLSNFEALGGPALKLVSRRVTYDLHSRDLIGDLHNVKNFVDPELLRGEIKGSPRDILTYVYYLPEPQRQNSDSIDDSGVATPGDAAAVENKEAEDEAHPDDDCHAHGLEEEYSKEFKNTREEATSLWHLVTHLPKNDFCSVCQQEKMQQMQHRRDTGSKKRRGRGLGKLPTKFGDEGTADHWVCLKKPSQGQDGETYGIT